MNEEDAVRLISTEASKSQAKRVAVQRGARKYDIKMDLLEVLKADGPTQEDVVDALWVFVAEVIKFET